MHKISSCETYISLIAIMSLASFLILLFAIQLGWMARQCHFIQVSVYSGVSICRPYDPKYDKTDFHMAPRRGLRKGQIMFFFHKVVLNGGGAKIIIFVFGGSGLDIFFPHFVLHSSCMATLYLHVHLKYPSKWVKNKIGAQQSWCLQEETS